MEYIGYRDPIGEGYFDMGLTHEEIVRCRGCKHSLEGGWRCARLLEEQWDEEMELGELSPASVRPDGFCAWAERRDA